MGCALGRSHFGGDALFGPGLGSARDSPLPPSQPVPRVAVVEGNVSAHPRVTRCSHFSGGPGDCR